MEVCTGNMHMKINFKIALNVGNNAIGRISSFFHTFQPNFEEYLCNKEKCSNFGYKK
jgi:hypothetical protein